MIEGFIQSVRNTMLRAALPTETSFYVGLFITAPTLPDGSVGVEASGAGYARVAMGTVSPGYQGIYDDGHNGFDDVVYLATDNDVTFAALTDALTVAAVGIWDAETGGNIVAVAPFNDSNLLPSSPVSFVAGDVITFPAGEVFFGLAGIVV